ncbi:chromatin assembly factor-I (CAF-I) p90 subunit [Sporothrix epigloea]|uniref:Chromatin assembly factor-I (CAF-I) p90 subunit n=1 Tax=Sporothrix epigloea TaxID=1892477 RepID=A0ABP0DUJ8_9PEZI
MSPNIQDGSTDMSTRKRSLSDYLEATNKPATPSKPKLFTNADSLLSPAKETDHQQLWAANGGAVPPYPASPTDIMSPDSPLSEMSDSHVSLLTDDAGARTPALPTPSKTVPLDVSTSSLPRMVIDLDMPIAGAQATLKQTETAAPPAKRKRLTATEREEKARVDAARKAEKEKAEALKKQERDEHKAAADAKKKASAEEREKKRRQREEEDRKKSEEKEKKRREKEEEDRKVQEAKDKKERSQLRLNSFFKTGGNASSSTSSQVSTPPLPPGSSSSKLSSVRKQSVSPQKVRTNGNFLSHAGAASSLDVASHTSTDVSEYDRIFKPFFIKENVTMATDLYGMDSETKEAKSLILDQYLSGSRGDFSPTKPFCSASASDYFHISGACTAGRGRIRPAVRKIMNMLGPDALYYGNLGGVSGHDTQVKLALDLLKSVPMKYLFFREDVRPAYYGTITSQPPQARLSKLARNPLAKTVLPLNYDYDSEAEWVDDGDGEDVDDLDDDEEEVEDDGEMSDFLDDSEDALPLRPAFSGGMEPESTGVCWENARRQAQKPELESLRMELILDHSWPIDPFATHYWETVESVAAPNAACASSSAPHGSAAPALLAPADAFAALGSGASVFATKTNAAAGDVTISLSRAAPGAAAAATNATGKAVDPKKTAGIAAEFLSDFKKSIMQYAKLSKVGIIEILSVEFTGKCTKSQIKNSLEALAERTGTGQNKTWKFRN